MKSNQNISLLLMVLLVGLSGQFLTGCAGLKAMSMVKSSSFSEDITIPFHRSVPVEQKAHIFMVEVQINDSGKTYMFAVDTGSITLFDVSIANDFDVIDETELNFSGSAGNTKKVRMVSVDKLSVSGLHVSSLAAVVTDLHTVSGPEIDGIIGSNFLQYFSVDFDYDKGTLSLSNGGFQPPPESEVVVVPFEKSMKNGFAPMATCTVDGMTLPCEIDTGYPWNFSVPSSVLKDLPGYKRQQYVESEGSLSAGLNGFGEKDIVVAVDQFAMEGCKAANVVMTTNQAKGDMLLIGKGFLDNYRVVIDYPCSTLYLLPKIAKEVSYPIYTYGFCPRKNDNGEVNVHGLWKDSPAARAGLAIGDEILAINDQAVEMVSRLTVMDMLMKNEEIIIDFKRDTGERKRVTLNAEDLAKRVSTNPERAEMR